MIKMMMSLGFTVLLTSSLTLAGDHHAPSPSFTAKKITDQVSMLTGKGGNIGVLSGKQGLLIVDDGYTAMSHALKKKLIEFGGSEQVRYVINTHFHADHTGNNADFGRDAIIVAHDNVRQRLLTGTEIKLFKMKTAPFVEHALPSMTFKKRLSIFINNEQVELLHFSHGHTDGDAVVFFKKANVLHTGDHYFKGVFPFVDLQHGGNAVRLAANVGQLLDRVDDKTQIIPGHGTISNKAELTAWHAMLLGSIAEVKAMKAQGLSLQTMQEKGLSNQWENYANGFISTETWIAFIDGSLK